MWRVWEEQVFVGKEEIKKKTKEKKNTFLYFSGSLHIRLPRSLAQTEQKYGRPVPNQVSFQRSLYFTSGRVGLV